MLQLSAKSNGQKGQLLEFWKDLIPKKSTWEMKLGLEDLIIINVRLTLVGIYLNMPIRIVLGGTSKTVLHGKTQSIIAGKLEDTVILEIQSKRENIDPQFQDQDYLYGTISNPVLESRTIVKSLYGLTDGGVRQNPLGVILCADRDALSVFLELRATGIE